MPSLGTLLERMSITWGVHCLGPHPRPVLITSAGRLKHFSVLGWAYRSGLQPAWAKAARKAKPEPRRAPPPASLGQPDVRIGAQKHNPRVVGWRSASDSRAKNRFYAAIGIRNSMLRRGVLFCPSAPSRLPYTSRFLIPLQRALAINTSCCALLDELGAVCLEPIQTYSKKVRLDQASESKM